MDRQSLYVMVIRANRQRRLRFVGYYGARYEDLEWSANRLCNVFWGNEYAYDVAFVRFVAIISVIDQDDAAIG